MNQVLLCKETWVKCQKPQLFLPEFISVLSELRLPLVLFLQCDLFPLHVNGSYTLRVICTLFLNTFDHYTLLRFQYRITELWTEFLSCSLLTYLSRCVNSINKTQADLKVVLLQIGNELMF